jgi:O-antigen/teichoic acid export membrane protein
MGTSALQSRRRWPGTGIATLRRLLGDASSFRSGVASTLATQIVLLGALTVQGALVARWLGPLGKGQLALVLLVLTVSQLLLNPGLEASYVYFTGSRRVPVPELTRLSVAVCLVVWPVGLGIASLLLVTGALRSALPGVPSHLVLLAVGLLPLTLLMSLLGSVLRGQQRFHILNRILIIDAVLSMTLGITLLIPLHEGVTGIIVANACGDGLAALLVARVLRREGARFSPLVPGEIRALLSYGARAQGGNLVQFFNYRLDQFLLNLLATTAAVGTYSVSVALSELVWLLPNAMSSVLFARAANESSSVMDRLTPRVARWTLALSLAPCAVLALGGGLVIRLVYSSAFSGAYTPLLWLLPGTAVFGVANVVAHDLAGRGHPGYNSLIAGVALGVTVGLNLLLVPTLGASGAAIASSASYGVTAVLTVLAFIRLRGSRRRHGDVRQQPGARTGFGHRPRSGWGRTFQAGR